MAGPCTDMTQGEGTVQTTNPPAGGAAKAVAGKHNLEARVQIPAPQQVNI
jgi:hypothetical protein